MSTDRPQWQPIETAPKDGTHILVWRDSGVHIARWSAKFGYWDQWHYPSAYCRKTPSHWMPLPSKPESGDPGVAVAPPLTALAEQLEAAADYQGHWMDGCPSRDTVYAWAQAVRAVAPPPPEPLRTHLGWLLAKVMKDERYPEARGIWESYCDWTDAVRAVAPPTQTVQAVRSAVDAAVLAMAQPPPAYVCHCEAGPSGAHDAGCLFYSNRLEPGDYLSRSDQDDLPVQDDRYPIGGMNPGLESIRPSRVLRLIAGWRATVDMIGPRLEGAAFEQCANDLLALLHDESDAAVRAVAPPPQDKENI